MSVSTEGMAAGRRRIIVDCSKLVYLCACILALAVPALGATVALPYYNLGGYHTSLRLVNPSATPVPVPHFWDPVGTGAGPVTVGPFETKAQADWPHAGAGMADLEVPEPLIAYVQVTDDRGSILRIPPVASSATALQVQDLTVGADQRAYVWATGADVGTIFWYRDDHLLSSEVIRSEMNSRSAVMPAPMGANRAVITPSFFDAHPRISVFAYHERQSGRYELQSVVQATEVAQ